MSTKGYKQLDEKEFNRIKELTNLLNNSQVVRATGRSISTVHAIGKSTDFADYKQTIKIYTDRQLARKKAARAVESPLPDLSQMELDLDGFVSVPPRGISSVPAHVAPVHLPTTQEQLVRIANALERLADAWEANPKKTGFFG